MGELETVHFPAQTCSGCGYTFNATANLSRLTSLGPYSPRRDTKQIVVCARCGQITVAEDLGPLGLTVRPATTEELVAINRECGSLLRLYTKYRAQHPVE